MQEIQFIRSYLMDVYGFKDLYIPKNRLESFKNALYSINSKLGNFLNRFWPIKFLDQLTVRFIFDDPCYELVLNLEMEDCTKFDIRLRQFIICDSVCYKYISCNFYLYNIDGANISKEIIFKSDEEIINNNNIIDSELKIFLSNFPICQSFFIIKKRNRLLDSIIE